MSEIQILAALEVKQTDRETFLTVMGALVASSRKEPGCLRYEFVEELNNPLSFCVVEKWASQEAIDEHNASPHFAKLVEFLNSHEVKADIKLFKQII